MRERLMKFRIMQTNTLRGILYEFGIVLPFSSPADERLGGQHPRQRRMWWVDSAQRFEQLGNGAKMQPEYKSGKTSMSKYCSDRQEAAHSRACQETTRIG